MERSTDRYLHKKFKKQLNIEVNNVEKEEKTNEMRFANNERVFDDKFSFGENAVTTGVYLSDIPVKNYRDNVPIISTNNKNTFSVLESSNVLKSSISHIDVVNAVEQSLRNANVIEDDSERSRAGELVDPQSSNSCISYVISKSSRIDNYTQREPQFRAVNFDTRFNVSEPIAIPAANTSSILDNVYSKQYVTSKLVNVEKAGDISSNISVINDHGTQEECINNNRNFESKIDNHLPDLNTTEKSSSGKYICSYCNLACSKPSVLQKHIRAHTNERPYPCVSCGFSFKTRSNLYKHCRSRTHANRVMGNKAQELHNEIDVDSQNKLEYNEQNNSIESVSDDALNRTKESPNEERGLGLDKSGQDNKSKPYKPRFHTAKTFFEDTQKNSEGSDTVQNRPSNSALLSLHINEVINKNNAIVNSNESYLIKKRSIENNLVENVNTNESVHRQNEIIYPQHTQITNEERIHEEPLNLTNKCRKRCLSEVGHEPAMHTSLIKELLLKNLSVDSMQCPHCKMIFQTVTELELHKFRSCKGFIKSGARYSRSSSVNVASILTKNKNAFDNIPHLQNAVFPLKSPGPFLGKTRLVESDKSKSFSFDDNLTHFPSNYQNTSEFLKTTLRYSISPLTTVQHDKVKRTQPVKLFGGQVKITQNTGETKSFKIDKDYDKCGSDHFDYGNSLSENRVVKSSLQSGGTILQNKSNYIQKQETLRSSPDVIRLYDSSPISPNIDILNLEKNKFTYERLQNQDLECEKRKNPEVIVPVNVAGQINLNNSVITSYKYTNIMDFSQNAVKQITPNIKQPNLTVPGVPAPNKLLSRSSSLVFEPKQSPLRVFDSNSLSRTPVESTRVNVINFSELPRTQETETRHFENIQFAQKQIVLQQTMAKELSSPCTPTSLCNPVNLLVNGKVVRYVPGIPGPIAAEAPTDVAYGGSQQRTVVPQIRTQKPSPVYAIKSSDSTGSVNNVPIDKTENRPPSYNGSLHVEKKHIEHDRSLKFPKYGALEINVNEPPKIIQLKSPSVKSVETKLSASKNDMKSPNNLAPPSSSISDSTRKFARPNTLALKPSIAAHKQHHGLTPTMFNQILISPDTPRVAKKYMQHFLHGNYFSYLGLKSSTKPVYCTLNKTQPFYVPHHFMKLSMYSEWRQQDIKGDKLYASAYDSRQNRGRYVTAGSRSTDLVVHSSYKFVVNQTICGKTEENKSNSILGGYESNEDYTYVRGRGRGRYVCDQCGIRCKKPSMLKKHIRTHTNDRPYTCSHCNFSFKTKGNLTKHMKSKAHTKNYAASSSSSSSAQQSGTQSSDSDTDDSGMDSSDESSTRQQEHEAAYGLLSLSQKTTQNTTCTSHTSTSSSVCSLSVSSMENRGSFMNAEQVTQVNNSNFAKNKILDQVTINFNAVRIINEMPLNVEQGPKEIQNLVQFLGKSNTNRPLTYPYTSDVMDSVDRSPSSESVGSKHSFKVLTELSNTSEFNREQKSNSSPPLEVTPTKIVENKRIPVSLNFEDKYIEKRQFNEDTSPKHRRHFQSAAEQIPNECRKRKIVEIENVVIPKLHKTESEAMDLSMPSVVQKASPVNLNGDFVNDHSVEKSISNENYGEPYSDETFKQNGVTSNEMHEINYQESEDDSQSALNLKTSHGLSNNKININYVYRENPNPPMITTFTEVPNSFSPMDYDNSAMETLADVATKQVKLEKDTLAKSVASEYLKFAKKQEHQANDNLRDGNFVSTSKEVNDLIVKSEENKSCSICSKSFSKPSQLRLHMNIHYLERPFRCDPCSISFRTKGHLQKHERSASHHNKLSSSPLLSSSEPRPFKCSDCNIAFRIHGHLAKHLRSKMHIMKLECLAKIPFGLYAELERANSLLTEINTTDGDQCLESLKILARKVFINDPSKLNQLEVSLSGTDTSDS